MKRFVVLALILVMMLPVIAVQAQDEVVELVMGSWRTEDIEQWDAILAVFEAEYPNIDIKFEPSLNTEYDGQLRNALAGGVGPDLITCRPFDRTLLLYDAGYMANIQDLPGLEHFSPVALSGWSTDDGSATYCVPMASVLHGFVYNVDYFNELGLEAPTTESEFFAVLDAIQEDGGMYPLAITSKDAWTTAVMGWENIVGNFAGGEPYRQAVIAGEASIDSPGVVAALESVIRWEPYMPDGHESIGYADTQQMFPLEMAAIYPSGSWEIPLFNSMAEFEMGAFMPYRPDDAEECWIDDHIDIAVGMNINTEHTEEARIFLEWLTTKEFAQVFSDNQPGFFSLSDHDITLDDPLAAEFLSWRQECGSTIRIAAQFLSRGEPALTDLMWNRIYLAVQGEISAEELAQTSAEGLAEWYTPPGE